MKYYKITLLILIVGLLNLSMQKKDNNYQIECVSLESDGYITIKIWDSKSGNRYKPEQARKDAIHAILFAGITGGNGCTSQIALLVKSEDIEKLKKIEKDFFSLKGDWVKFTRNSTTETTLPINLGEKNWKVYQVSVAKDALQKYLEENQIIKSIKTGF